MDLCFRTDAQVSCAIDMRVIEAEEKHNELCKPQQDAPSVEVDDEAPWKHSSDRELAAMHSMVWSFRTAMDRAPDLLETELRQRFSSLQQHSHRTDIMEWLEEKLDGSIADC